LRRLGFTDDTSESDGATSLAIRKHSQCKKILAVIGHLGGAIHIWNFEENILMFSLQRHANMVTKVSILEKKSEWNEKEDDVFIIYIMQLG
jgi:hypothetical protein